jgi:uncharacterized protein with FMN-binding domain
MRAVLATLATIVGVVLLISFKTPDLSGAARVPTASSSVPATPSSPSASNGDGSPSPATPSPTAVAGSGLRDGTYTGADAPNQYGDVQVRITVSGGRITGVQALQLPTDRQRSAEISQQAGPLLQQEALQAQSARVDSLSGATYTSYSYAQSLQSALDQAHA